ncbi:aspartic proteinase CDR1-like [Salvia hispanica]|uniref:aspartic proteinase CDR1-like n=1 Tax=Salvia hispanica TaxID=49212 RepID=UPI002009A3C1|nr:aspartic proteinase CDR1-like [Salvia hispanica]
MTILRPSFNHHANTRISQTPLVDIFSDKGEYLMKLSIGTPPVETLAVVDTGSDLVWIQCKPCTECFLQKAPLFQPKLSSTYKPAACTSAPCNALHGRTSCLQDTCRYTIGYGDKSFSIGYLATETLRLGSVAIPNVVIGCGHNNRGTFGPHVTGIVGLGGGELSLITQMGSLIRGRFSYCLGSYIGGALSSSKMSFGDDADVSGDDVETTVLVARFPKTFYFLTLEGISVGNNRIEFDSHSSSNSYKGIEDGNIIIDSGTTLTFLPQELYNKVTAQVRSHMNMKEVDDPKGLLDLCYYSTSVTKVPEIVFHFKGADVKLKPLNTFIKTRENNLCLAFAPTNDEPIFGNLAQMDFLIGYDLENKIVSFKPTDCN